jgi:prepilin-type N-terminal cleavage/methylation domain-containing protein
VSRRAFTLPELLVAIAMIAALVGLLVPSLAAARAHARAAACLSNQRQLVTGWTLYAADFAGRAMPAGDERAASPDILYWWGAVTAAPAIDHARGFLFPYLDAPLAERSVCECPCQPWGSYRAQPIAIPPPGSPTSTYGYNGYYLCPPMTPGWNQSIGRQPWKRLGDLERPTDLLVFADTLLPGTPPRNDALLDPPMLFSPGAGWTDHDSPTTCFRHLLTRAGGSAAAARADGSARLTRAEPGWLIAPDQRIGSLGRTNDPHYVPDWRRWR